MTTHSTGYLAGSRADCRSPPTRSVADRPGDPLFDDVVAAAARGDAAAIRLLYDRLAGPVATYLRSRGCPDVDDTTSEVLISVFTGLGRFSGTEEDFRAWVFTIARRRWIDEQRRAARRVQVICYDPNGDRRHTVSAEDEALSEVAIGDVGALLARLSPDQREVLELHLLVDLPIEQVARVMGKQPDAVKSLLRRGLAALRRLVVELYPEAGR